jgi:hypothetical protein
VAKPANTSDELFQWIVLLRGVRTGVCTY